MVNGESNLKMVIRNDWRALLRIVVLVAFAVTALTYPGDGQPVPPLHQSLGAALYARGYRVSAWYRQPDGSLVTGRFDPNVVDFEVRYGAGSSTRKGSIQGENICPDFIFPELAVDLGLPVAYQMSRIDLQDLRMVRDAYKGLQAMYRRKTGLEPCASPIAPQPASPCPAGTSCRAECFPSTATCRCDPTICPPPPECLTCPVLAVVPERVRETIHILDGWPAGRAFGAAMQRRSDELAAWLLTVVSYRPSLLSTGHLDTMLVPR